MIAFSSTTACSLKQKHMFRGAWSRVVRKSLPFKSQFCIYDMKGENIDTALIRGEKFVLIVYFCFWWQLLAFLSYFF